MFMQVLINGLVAGAMHVLVGLGFSIVFQTARFFDFAFAGVLTIAAYVVVATGSIGMPVFFGLCLAVFTAAIVGGAFDCFVYRRLRRRAAPKLVLMLSALGLWIAVVNGMALVFGDSPRILGARVAVNSIAIGPIWITPLQTTVIILALTLTLVAWGGLHYTRLGLVARALANDETLAICCGARTEHVLFWIAVAGSAMGGMAAALVAADTGVSPTIALRVLLPGVVAVVIGGVGKFSGLIVAGFGIGLLQQLAAWFVSTAWEDAIVFIILIIFLLLRPEGAFGGKLRKTMV